MPQDSNIDGALENINDTLYDISFDIGKLGDKVDDIAFQVRTQGGIIVEHLKECNENLNTVIDKMNLMLFMFLVIGFMIGYIVGEKSSK